MRRSLLSLVPAAALALALALAGFGAAAQQPDQPVKIVVPYSPGGSSDVLARAISEELGKALGQAVIVENRPGAGSLLATQFVAGESANGNTLLLVDVPFTIVPALYRERAKYDIQKDFVPISLMGVAPTYLFVNEASPARSAADLIKSARAKPATVSIGSGGNGALTHLMAELFMINTGIKLVHIPYKGASAAVNDLAAGQIESTFTTMASASGLYRAGRLRALAVSSPRRQQATPDVPTFQEGGIPNMTVESWWGLVAPGGTSQAVQARLRDAMRQVMNMPGVRTRMQNAGVEVPADTGPDALRKFIREDAVRWRDVVERAKIKLE
jgi:tripartite-type tricarboxylate transporter receptor subunit TctC